MRLVSAMKQIYPGIYRFTLGIPEKHTPFTLSSSSPAEALSSLPAPDCRFTEEEIGSLLYGRGIRITIPLSSEESLYGFGLQLKSFEQTGRKRVIRTNADPRGDSGESHAPVPFYVSTAGYGVFVDTARDVSFYCGSSRLRDGTLQTSRGRANTTEELYAVSSSGNSVVIDIPFAKGADIYIFEGPGLKDAVARYNLFSGGGVLPPLWGLGFLYRGYGGMNQEDVLRIAGKIREDKIPCDMIGLEPGWHSHAYSCTYQWDSERFSRYGEMLRELSREQFHVNLWEQAFVYHEADIYPQLADKSGDFLVWEGLVPDFADADARRIFAEKQKSLIKDGISGFKLDECDGSDFTGGWSYPHCSLFPSGLDGEQMHNQLGVLFQKTVNQCFQDSGLRTYGEVRASHAFAASLPFVLYSDLYDHDDYIRGLTSSGFSGLLWTPEVRQTDSAEEYIRRMQAVICSPLATVNAWMIPNPPWRQYHIEQNCAGSLLPTEEAKRLTDITRRILELRMSLIPYLYSAFHRYHTRGIPPFRAMVMDYPDDPETRRIEDQILIGDGLMAAPVVYGKGNHRRIYLPEGEWYDFETGEKLSGKRWMERDVPLETLPLFVKTGTVLPLAEPTQFASEAPYRIHLNHYGRLPSEITLRADDGISTRNEFDLIRIDSTPAGYTLSVSGDYGKTRYEIVSHTAIL